MKKLIALLLAALFAITMTACPPAEEPAEDEAAPVEEATEEEAPAEEAAPAEEEAPVEDEAVEEGTEEGGAVE